MDTRAVRSMGCWEHQVTRDIDRKNRELSMMASTNEVDSYGSIILPSAFADGMEAYMRNPVILKNHNRLDEVYGKTLAWKIHQEGAGGLNGLEKRVQFAPSKKATELFLLYAEDYMRAWSVGGGVPHANIVNALSTEEKLAGLPDYARQALRDGKARFIFTKFMLRETSAVTIGANPGALSRAAEDGLIELSVARALYEEAVESMSAPWIAAEKAKIEAELDQADILGANLTARQALVWGVLSRFRV